MKVEKLTDKVVETTTALSEKSLKTAKTFPLHTALVAGVVGLIVVIFAKRKVTIK